ncbi:MAG: hydantoinase/oxoprolinase family protein, partial [Geminicoccaceae bacterium]
PGQFSAYGFILTDARVDRHRTTQLTSKRFDAARASEVMQSIVAEARLELEDQGYTSNLEVVRALEMRYLGQNYELEMTIDFEDFEDAAAGALWQAFHAAHEARFGFSIPGEIIEIVKFSATAVARGARFEPLRIERAAGEPRPSATRAVGFAEGRHEVPVFRREQLAAGHEIPGPALIEEAASVTVLNPGQHLHVDDFGHLVIRAGT